MYYYDKEGKEISLSKWGVLFEDSSYQRIKISHIDNDTEVSTVWLGLDHSFEPDGKLLIFESMIFSDIENINEMTERYATLEAALHGHDVLSYKAWNAVIKKVGGWDAFNARMLIEPEVPRDVA